MLCRTSHRAPSYASELKKAALKRSGCLALKLSFCLLRPDIFTTNVFCSPTGTWVKSSPKPRRSWGKTTRTCSAWTTRWSSDEDGATIKKSSFRFLFLRLRVFSSGLSPPVVSPPAWRSVLHRCPFLWKRQPLPEPHVRAELVCLSSLHDTPGPSIPTHRFLRQWKHQGWGRARVNLQPDLLLNK